MRGKTLYIIGLIAMPIWCITFTLIGLDCLATSPNALARLAGAMALGAAASAAYATLGIYLRLSRLRSQQTHESQPAP